jgi:hypothetical protein
LVNVRAEPGAAGDEDRDRIPPPYSRKRTAVA